MMTCLCPLGKPTPFFCVARAVTVDAAEQHAACEGVEGLGDTVAKVAMRLGKPPCRKSITRARKILNKAVPYRKCKG